MRSLQARIPVLAMAVLAASCVMGAIIAFELLQVARRSDLDDTLLRERHRFAQSITRISGDIARDRDAPRITPEAFRRAVRDYLRLNPSNQSYLTIVRIGGDVLTSERGPSELLDLRRSGQIPQGPEDRLATVPSAEGDIRTLSSRVNLGDETAATFQVAAPLEPITQASLRALGQLAVAALISLIVGGALLAITLRRALRPLSELADTARAIEAEDLSVRVHEPENRDEVAVLAREFNRMLERLEVAEEGRRRLLAFVSHELRTPITIARGHIETLGAVARDPEALAETTSVMREELQHMGRLVEDLMALARFEAAEFVIATEIGLGQLFAELKLRLTGMSVDNVTIHAPPPATIRVDPERIAQALMNLIINAHIHTPPGSRIDVGARLQDDHVVFFVRDNGPGIDPSIKDKVFEPFVRLQGSSDHETTGLGLAVVKVIAVAHGGKAVLDSDSRGTIVSVWIPTPPPLPVEGAAQDGEATGEMRPVTRAPQERAVNF